MKKILLTSTGFDNKNIENKFISYLTRKVNKARVLFIPTAAIDAESIMILKSCIADLTNAGIVDKNIIVYDLYKEISYTDIKNYDAIYVCGGDTDYLYKRMEELDFFKVINMFVRNGGIYIGVSAGSVVCSGNYQNNLSFIKNPLEVHCEEASKNGIINSNETIYLTNNQAICFDENGKIIVFE